MDQTYDFNEAFQSKLLSLVFIGTVSPTIVQASYFTNPIHSEICDSIITLRQEYGDITPDMLETHLLRKKTFRDREYKQELREMLPSIFKVVKRSERSYLFDLAFKFAKLQQYRDFFRQGVDILQDATTESLEQLDQLFTETSMVSKIDEDIGDFYFSSLPTRLKYRNQEKKDILSTCIPPLDKCLADGGISKGELLVFAGLASQGKSFSLLHMATAALVQNKKVIFYSLEMEAYKIATRLDASFTGVLTHEVKEYGERIEKRLTNLQKQFGDNLLIKRMPAGRTRVSDLEAHLDTMKFKGFIAEVIIVDYINLMRPESTTREGRHRDLGDVYIGLKGLGQARSLYPITAAQSNRTGFNAPLITIQHFADTFEGGMHCLVSTSLIDCPRDLNKYPNGIPIKDLVGKKFFTYSWSRKKKRFVLREARNVAKTGCKAEVWKMVWYDGYTSKFGEIIATPNHRIMLRNGKYVKLKNLKPNDSLQVLRRTDYSKPYKSIRVAPNIQLSEHRFVYQEVHGVSINSDNVVHHIDENIYNNHPDNLSEVFGLDHISYHHTGKIVSEETRRKIGIKSKQRVTSDETRKRLSIVTSGKNNPMFGRKHSEEAKRRISETKRRRFEEKVISNHVVVSVEFFGYEDVYDMEVEGTHNFVANEIVVHNSDIIITLNRNDEEAQQEKIRLYVAKDRDGVDKRVIEGYTNYKKGSFWSRKHSQSMV